MTTFEADDNGSDYCQHKAKEGRVHDRHGAEAKHQAYRFNTKTVPWHPFEQAFRDRRHDDRREYEGQPVAEGEDHPQSRAHWPRRLREWNSDR